MRIAFYETDKKEEKYFREKLKKHKSLKMDFFTGKLDKKSVEKARDAEAIVIFVNCEASKEVLRRMPKLWHIATMSTGFDHIDLEECRKREISVSNVPFYGENTVAEHTFGLILNLSRKIYLGIEKTKRDDFSLHGLEGFDLKGKTIGVIGPGHIGQHVIRMAHGFQMNVIAYAHTKENKLAKKFQV